MFGERLNRTKISRCPGSHSSTADETRVHRVSAATIMSIKSNDNRIENARDTAIYRAVFILKLHIASCLCHFLSEIAYLYGCYRSVVCLFVCLCVCLSRSCIVLKRQKISTRYDSPMSLPEVFKIWLTSVNSFIPKVKITISTEWLES